MLLPNQLKPCADDPPTVDLQFHDMMDRMMPVGA